MSQAQGGLQSSPEFLTLIATPGGSGRVASAASMAAVPATKIGSRSIRVDDNSGGPEGTEYMLMRAPASRAHNWKPVYNGAAHMLFGARPDARDVPYGTVIAGTDILNARFVAQTKNGITDWYPEGGSQVIGVWEGEADLYVASSTATFFKQTGILIPAGVAGLNGTLSCKMVLGQMYNTTASGTPLVYVMGRLRRRDSTAGLTVAKLNDAAGSYVGLPTGATMGNKKSASISAQIQMLGDPLMYAYSPDVANANASAGNQIQYGYVSLEADFELDMWSSSSASNASAKLVRVELSVGG